MRNSLVRIPFSQINQGLERLTELGITDGHWHRLRLDDGFAKGAAELLQKLDKQMAGIHLSIKMEMSLVKAGKTLLERRYNSLSPEALEKLHPRNRYTPSIPIDNTFRDVYIVSPERAMTEREAYEELERRGLEPCQAEEGLAVAVQFTCCLSDDPILVLDARYESERIKGVLCLGLVGNGTPHISIWEFSEFSGRMRYLARRK